MGETGADVPIIEKEPKTENPGLLQAKQLVQRYRSLFIDTNINEAKLDKFLTKFDSGISKVIQDTSSPASDQGIEKVIRTDAAMALLVKLRKHGEDKLAVEQFNEEYAKEKFSEEINTYNTSDYQQKLETDFYELQELLFLKNYLNKTINQTAWPQGYSRVQETLDWVVDLYKVTTLQNLLQRVPDFIGRDVLREERPSLKEGLSEEEKGKTVPLLRSLNTFLFSFSGPEELKREYLDLLEPLEKEGQDSKVHSVVHMFSSGRKLNLSSIFDTPSMIKEFAADIARKPWENLVVSTKTTKQIYDILSPVLLKDLFEGGHESWPGTTAASVFYYLRDPRVLPSLIQHLRTFGSGHTSASVAGAIEEIANKPLDKEDLEEVLLQLSPLERSIINKMFRNPDTAIYKITHPLDGYMAAGVIQGAEHFLPRANLLDLVIEEAKAKGEEIDREILRAYFYNNDYIDTSKVEDILIENIDQTAVLIAKSKSVDWKSFSPRIFNALISPKDGEISKFPKIIVSEGLGLGSEYLEKIEKLYQSGDLRRGVISRSAFAEGLLFLAARDDGSAILKDILDKSTGANRDAERIRKIFMLMKSLEGMGKVKYARMNTLNETILDLKNKLVSVVGKKMELGKKEAHSLYENLDDLLKTGIFEIIPPLLSKFNETRKGQVANCVREIGRHIVMGDFKTWRDSSEAAKKQLSVLSEDKQAIWLNESKESIQELGINKHKEVRLGALDAIKRIAAEAKAHILEIYKLDFSLSGINALKYRQKELVSVLKGSLEIQEKKDLGEQKRKIDDEIRIIEGLMGLEALNLENLDAASLTKNVASIQNALETFQGLDQPASDLSQIAEVLTTQAEIGNVFTIRAYDTDEPFALLKVGIEPRETCQSYRGGSHNYCLPAYVADANKRVINAENEKKEVLGRGVMKLTHVTTADGIPHPAILLEPVYTTSEIVPIYRGVARVALEKAKAIGAYLVMVREFNVATGADHKRTIPVIEQEAKRLGREIKNENLQVFVPQSNNSYEYSDSLGGDLSYFETYHTLNDALIVTP